MSRTRRLVLMPLLAVAVGVLVGGAVVGLAILLAGRTDTDRDTFADLGVLVMGLVLGVVVGVVVWLVVLSRAAVRLFPRGRRLMPVLWSAVAVFVLVLGWNALSGAFDDGAALPTQAADALLWVGMLVVLTAPSVVFLLHDRRLPPSP